MSTKTTFKRIALVAVAALGLGVLSVAPSSATVSNIAVTITNGTGGTALTATTANIDSTTGAAITVSGLFDASTDTVTIGFAAKSVPAGTNANATMRYIDSTTPLGGTNLKLNNGTGTANKNDTQTSGVYVLGSASGTGYRGASFTLELETATATTKAGTYTYTMIVKAYSAGVVTSTQTSDASITIAPLATASTTVASASSKAFINAGTATSATSDSVVTSVATADGTTVATIPVVTKNAAGGDAAESITASISGPGLVCSGTTCGKSLTVAGTGSSTITIQADGNAGVATVSIATTSVTFAPKSVTFYAKSPKTITASVYNPTLLVGTNASAVAATAVDAAGIAWTGKLYIVASSAADALVGGSATAPQLCTYSPTYAVHFCPISTIATGSAKFKVVDQSLDVDGTYAAADSAATSNEVAVTVSNAAPATVKLAFDKATYAPFEKALITVTVLDKDGKTLQGQTFANLFAAGGITANQAFGSSSDTLTAVSLTTATANGTDATAGAKTYVVYMPAQGVVKISATGGTSLAAAGQVAVSATASVVNSSVDAATDAANEATDAANAATDAALAAADAADAATAAAQDASDAVAALSATVDKLVASLKAQITSLTNLVIKIQKKVKA